MKGNSESLNSISINSFQIQQHQKSLGSYPSFLRNYRTLTVLVFNKMVLRISPILFRYVWEFTSSVSPDRTQKTAQETWWHLLTLSYTAPCQAAQKHSHEAGMPHSSEAYTHLSIFNINGFGFFYLWGFKLSQDCLRLRIAQGTWESLPQVRSESNAPTL